MNYLRLIEVYEDQCQVDNLHWLHDAYRAIHHGARVQFLPEHRILRRRSSTTARYTIIFVVTINKNASYSGNEM